MPTLSVIMIVKNEAASIGACLESVRVFADEMVVADTGSTDETVAIAESQGARVIHIPWNDDFAAARNRSMAAATGDWLLHMDADEVLDAEGAARLREVVAQDGCGADAIELVIANYCDDPRAWRWVAVEPNAPYARGRAGYVRTELLRLFRNRMGFEYREPVHENITESVIERGGRIRREDIIIHHHGYTGGEAGSEKAGRYLAISRKKCSLRPDAPKAWHDLSEQALACGCAEEAESACRKALAIDSRYMPAVMTLANLLLNRGAMDEARPLLEALLLQGNAPLHAEVALAAIDCREGRPASARRRLACVLEQDPRCILGRLYLARAHDQLGEYAHALRELELARDLAPSLNEPRTRVEAHRLRSQGERFFETGFGEEALASLVQALRLDPEDPITHNDLGVVLHAMGEMERARASFERAHRLAPGLKGTEQDLSGL